MAAWVLPAIIDRSASHTLTGDARSCAVSTICLESMAWNWRGSFNQQALLAAFAVSRRGRRLYVIEIKPPRLQELVPERITQLPSRVVQALT